MFRASQRAWISWLSIGLLGLLCATLAVLQYRWIGEIAIAERTRLREDLQARLMAFSRAFNDEIATALHALPSSRNRSFQLIRRAGLAFREGEEIRFLSLDKQNGRFAPAEWPSDWIALRDRLERPFDRGGGRPAPLADEAVLEVPQFSPDRQEWLIAQVDTDFVKRTLLPEILRRYFGDSGMTDYDIQVVTASMPPSVVDGTGPARTNADASAPLLDVRPVGGIPRGRGFGFREGGPREGRGFDRGPGGPPPPNGGPGRWRVLARHKMGSLEALVTRTQRRNLAVSGAVLLLILGTAAMLVRFSREAQRLAELQMNFVAGVSHELRTPLTVIRTAAWNLRNPKFRARPDQVERYGQLIESESGKLEALVEQVLLFSSAKAGHAIRERVPVRVATLIGEELASFRNATEDRNVIVEESMGADIPVILADATALRHALRNLLDNALKYGAKENNWIGVYAGKFAGASGPEAEIRVVDRGPGIPAEEQKRIFDPFFRGRSAVRDQAHGTGLGLNLVKAIVEAHGGSVQVKSTPGIGTEFTVRIPATPREVENEFTHSAG
ncbi:MAG TPA: HAMP domain-containing sensor histidine kinase [Bryobacteraceae bacterium]|nr:HAMP domain-containing sensor histidine kinase [Bryobacteraceae bacterium]